MEHPTTCPACNTKVTNEGYHVTLLGYRPQPPHDHDPNCYVHMYTCQNGHQISQREIRSCPAPECQWKQPETCFCHPIGFRVYDPATDSFLLGGDPRKPLKDLVTTYAPGS